MGFYKQSDELETAGADRTAKLPARVKKPPRLVVWITVQLRRLLLPGRTAELLLGGTVVRA